MTTYAECIGERLKNKLVEIYFGDTFENVEYADNSRSIPSVMIGKIIDAVGDCIVLDCSYAVQKKLLRGNIVYVNSYNICAICELDGRGTLKDAIYSTDDSPHVPGDADGNQ